MLRKTNHSDFCVPRKRSQTELPDRSTMKFLLLFTITTLLCSINGAFCVTINSAVEEQVLIQIARSVSEFAAYKLRDSEGPVKISGGHEVEPLIEGEVTFIPPITDDPLALPPVNEANIDLNLDGLLSVTGNLSILDPQASGLMELTDLLKFNYATTLTIDIDVGLPALQITSPYDLDLDLILTVLNDTSLSLVGIGDLIFGASDLFLNFHGKGLAPVIGFMRLNELDVDLGFKNLEFSLACLEINGTPNDLGHFAGLIQSVFDLVWTDDNKVLVNEMIRCAIDDLISRCNIGVIVGGDLTCLDKPIKVECFEMPDVPTGPTSGTTQAPITSTSTNTEPTTPSTNTEVTTPNTEKTTTDSSKSSFVKPQIVSILCSLIMMFSSYLCL